MKFTSVDMVAVAAGHVVLCDIIHELTLQGPVFSMWNVEKTGLLLVSQLCQDMNRIDVPGRLVTMGEELKLTSLN